MQEAEEIFASFKNVTEKSSHSSAPKDFENKFFVQKGARRTFFQF